MARCGVVVTYETIRDCSQHFGGIYAKRPPIASRYQIVRHGALAIIDLRLFVGTECEPIELRWLDRLQGHHEALHAVVSRNETKPIDQILVNRHRVTAEQNRCLDELAVWLAARRRLFATGQSRWAEWGI